MDLGTIELRANLTPPPPNQPRLPLWETKKQNHTKDQNFHFYEKSTYSIEDCAEKKS